MNIDLGDITLQAQHRKLSTDFQDNIVIDDDPKDINKRSKAMLDEVNAELAREEPYLDESKLKLLEEDFNCISDKKSSIQGSFVPPSSILNPVLDKKSDFSNFKKPFAVPRVKRKASEPGMMTSKECFYCVLELPDNISLALHYVRQHWVKVRQEQKHKGPKSKFHNVDNLQDDRTIFAPQFHVSKLANAAKAKEMDFAKKMQNLSRQTPSNWLQKLDGNLKTSKTLPIRSDYSQALQAYQARNAAVNQKLSQQRKTFEAPFKKPRFILPKPVPSPVTPASTEVSCETCDDDFNWPEKDHDCPRKKNSGTSFGIGGDVLVNRVITNKGMSGLGKGVAINGTNNKGTTSKSTNNHLITNKLVSKPILIED